MVKRHDALRTQPLSGEAIKPVPGADVEHGLAPQGGESEGVQFMLVLFRRFDPGGDDTHPEVDGVEPGGGGVDLVVEFARLTRIRDYLPRPCADEGTCLTGAACPP